MATHLVIRDDVDVVRIVDALLETSDALAATGVEQDGNEGRARLILANRLGDALDEAGRRDRARAARRGRTVSP